MKRSQRSRGALTSAAGLMFALVLAGVVGPVGVAGANPSSNSPILLGSVGSYTEPGEATGLPGEAPIKAWADWVNAHGGINGHPVKLFVMDDQGNQARRRLRRRTTRPTGPCHCVRIRAGRVTRQRLSKLSRRAEDPRARGQRLRTLSLGQRPDVLPTRNHPSKWAEGRNYVRKEGGLQEVRLTGVLRIGAVCTGQRSTQVAGKQRRPHTTSTARWRAQRRPTTRPTAWRRSRQGCRSWSC